MESQENNSFEEIAMCTEYDFSPSDKRGKSAAYLNVYANDASNIFNDFTEPVNVKKKTDDYFKKQEDGIQLDKHTKLDTNSSDKIIKQ